MKNIINLSQIIALFLSLMIFNSCSDYLDKEKEEILNEEIVFSNQAYTFEYLTAIYANLPIMAALENDYTQNPFVGASDEMEITYKAAFCQQINSGAWGPSNIRTANGKTIIWGLQYEGIRKSNIFLANIDKVPMDENIKKQWKGEAIFLRAMFHFNIARCFGPIPIEEKVYTPDEDYTKIERQPVDVVYKFIASECDKAAALLDPTVPENEHGRATKVAALGLKSRALLYLASPLWNGNSDYTDFKINGKRMVPDYDINRWKEAYEAAKQCIDIAEAAGYKLYTATNNDPVENYRGIFLNNHNVEVLYARNIGSETQFEGCANPLSQGGFSIYCPTQEMVDAYEMADGSTPITGYNGVTFPIINPSSGYTESGFTATADPKGYYQAGISNMYVKREPRFYASINYNGAKWKGRTVQFWYTGIDGLSHGSSDYCVTGYLQRKMVDPNSNILQWKSRDKAYIYIRLAEIYLNYAEALNEYNGPVDDVYIYINKVRNRSGLPDLPSGLTQAQIREKIMHERRVEFAFEGYRYFDVRRWNIAGTIDNKEITGMNITAGNNLADPNYYKRVIVEKRVFESPKHNLWPIPQSEIDKCPNLGQNPKW